MKIAITSTGTTFDSVVDLRFGRAKHFVLFDPATNTTTIVDNVVNLNAAQGAGIQAAKTISDSGAGALITGHVGPKAYTALNAGGIGVYSVSGGTIAEALKQFQSGSLTAMSAPDVEGHW